MGGALAFLMTYLPQLPTYVAAGTALADVIKVGLDKAEQLKTENRDPTDTDWAEVNASIAGKRARLHAP